MIFSEPRDPRLITVRRGGTLSDTNHHLLALWAAACAEHVLHCFEEVQVAARTASTGERVSICYRRYMSLKKLQKEEDSTPPQVHGDCAEMVKRMANTQPVSNKKLVKRQEKPKG